MAEAYASERAQRDAELTERIRAIHKKSRGTYGRPRVHAELREENEHVGQKRVGRLMRQEGLEGVSRRRKVKTTRRDSESRPAPDLVDRTFAADRPDQLWVADIHPDLGRLPVPGGGGPSVWAFGARARRMGLWRFRQ